VGWSVGGRVLLLAWWALENTLATDPHTNCTSCPLHTQTVQVASLQSSVTALGQQLADAQAAHAAAAAEDGGEGGMVEVAALRRAEAAAREAAAELSTVQEVCVAGIWRCRATRLQATNYAHVVI
jgi:hypothetical protein